MFHQHNDTTRQILVISSLVMVLIVNALATALPINGITTGDISDSFSVYFVPAGYVFSVWGVIYIFQIAYIVYQALPSQKNRLIHRDIAPWYLLTSVANTMWIFLWHYLQFTASVIVMTVILFGLIAIYRLTRLSGSRADFWLISVPFSLYLAWITVATVANYTSWLESIGWKGFGISELIWGVVILVVAGIIETIMVRSFRDVAYLLVVVWALVGIAVKHSDTLPIAITASVMAAIIVVALVRAKRSDSPLVNR